MKRLLLLLPVLYCVGVNSQNKLKDDISAGVIFEGGFNFENRTNMPVQPYHIDLLENGLGTGGYFRFGGRFTYKDKLFLQLSPKFGGSRRNIKDFEIRFKQFFPNQYVYLRRPARFVNLMGVQFALGYNFNFDKLSIAPYFAVMSLEKKAIIKFLNSLLLQMIIWNFRSLLDLK